MDGEPPRLDLALAAISARGLAVWQADDDNTGLLVRAGLAAVPYLLRQEHWNRAVYLLEHAFIRAPSRASAAALLPAITRIADHEPDV